MEKRLDKKQVLKILQKHIGIAKKPYYIQKSSIYDDLHYHIKDSDFKIVIRVCKSLDNVIKVSLYYNLEHIVDIPSYGFELKWICKMARINQLQRGNNE